MKTTESAYSIGREYAEQSGCTCPVDIDSMKGHTQDIPNEDYRYMRQNGIDPDAGEYWAGFNSYFA